MTRYCPDCGDSHECTAELERRGDDGETQIRLAEITANRDVRIAELGAGAVKAEAAAAVDIAEAEAESDTARAEGEAAGMETVLEAAAPNGDEAEEPAIIEIAGDEGEEPPEAPPPPPEAEPAQLAESSRGGFWGPAYR